MQLKKIGYGKNNLITSVIGAFLLTITITACDRDNEVEKPEADEIKEKTIILSPDGIGPINATTSFNMHQMTLAFSDFSVVEEVNFLDSKPLPAIRISQGVNTIMHVIPDASLQGIYSVMVEDNIIKNSLGHHLGTPYSEIYSYGQNEECQPGADDMSGKMLCYAPKHPNILYVFNGAWDNAKAGTAPPADILQGWSLESIIWRPNS